MERLQPKPNQEESLPAEKPRDSIRKSALTEELIELDIPTLIFEGKNEVKKEIKLDYILKFNFVKLNELIAILIRHQT